MEILFSILCIVLTTTFVNGKELDCSGIQRSERFFGSPVNPRPAVELCEEYEFRYVTNGTPTKRDEFPFMCAIGWKTSANSSSYKYNCGGAVINLYFVLTAAHCAYVDGKQPDVILPGGPNLTDTSGINLAIAEVIIHPDYDPDSVYNDIAIIRTNEQIYVNVACLWVNYELPDYNVTIMGYGDTRFAGSSSPQLLKAELQAIRNEECARYYDPTFRIENGITTKQLCAKDSEALRDSCQGDSGGPLIVQECRKEKVRAHVVGITSFGFGCAGEQPSVYTRVSEYVDWIEGIVRPA